ncbi:MAG: AhpC/TSA family protein [Actinobacteria bacterium]|nr:AhpC/TSA family protein [Actinomycetota bacterium]
MALKSVEIPLADVKAQTASGEVVRIGDLVDRPTVLVVPRYYGCLPCRGYLRDVTAALPELAELGAGALAVSSGADFQARWLMEEQGVAFPLLVDPERHTHEALALPRRWWVALHPKGWWKYLRAIFRGNRQGRIVDPIQIPGLALLDEHAVARRIHRGRALGDYPPIATVLDELRNLSAT